MNRDFLKNLVSLAAFLGGLALVLHSCWVVFAPTPLVP